jgi:curved DNA-binding protein CbpA
MANDHLFVDYYDVLQVSQNANPDTIQRVFRYLAKRYHPDLPNGGDPETFRQILNAYSVLINPEKRAAYDLRYQEYWDHKYQILRQATEGTAASNTEIRNRLLTVLFVQRRTDMRHPGIGDMELARLMRMPIEFMEFDLWYLRKKGLVEMLETGQMAISVDGVDYVERHNLRTLDDHLLEAHNPDQGSDAERIPA